MGCYIEGPRQGKAEFLKKEYGALQVSESRAREAIEDPLLGVICIVYNTTWDAAGFAYNLQEFWRMEMRPDDRRPRRWMVMERGLAERLSGYSVSKPSEGLGKGLGHP